MDDRSAFEKQAETMQVVQSFEGTVSVAECANMSMLLPLIAGVLRMRVLVVFVPILETTIS